MHRNFVTLTSGVLLAAALAAPAAAQASVRHSAPARPPVTAARPADTIKGSGSLIDQGHQEYAGILISLTDPRDEVFFAGKGSASGFENISIPISGQFQIGAAGECLAVDSLEETVDGDSSAACHNDGGDGDVWDRWTATKVGTTGGVNIWEFKNAYNGQCLYHDDQRQAIYAKCNLSDHFEWMEWPGSNL